MFQYMYSIGQKIFLLLGFNKKTRKKKKDKLTFEKTTQLMTQEAELLHQYINEE